jgi:hypothetical protein
MYTAVQAARLTRSETMSETTADTAAASNVPTISIAWGDDISEE